MSETIKALWLTDENGVKIAPKTLSSQVINEDGTLFKDKVRATLDNAVAQKSQVQIITWEADD